MNRRQWTGLAGVLFGVVMLIGLLSSGTTPDSDGGGAVDRYTKYWSDSDNQSKAAVGSFILLYAWVLLACFAAGLRHLLQGLGDSALRSVVHGAGTASAALFAVGAALVNAVGLAGKESSGFKVDGNDAILLEDVSYYVLTAAVMMAAAMAVAFALANRSARLLPAWTIVLSALLAIAGLGALYTAWLGFMLLPIWAIVVGGLLLATRGADEPATA
jgi:succinate dehydrogenase/fumarate reductase cytochrome b subunit